MSESTLNPYLRTKVLTATPAELRLMLLDGVIKFAAQGRDGLRAGDHEAAYNGVSRAQAILMELINTLEPRHAPELCGRISALYTYLYTELMKALSAQRPSAIDDVIERLEYERETWSMLMEKLAAEHRAASPVTERSGAPAPTESSSGSWRA